MTSVVDLERAIVVDPAPAAAPARSAAGRRGRWAWPEHWPLTALLAGYPVWWLLGVDSLLPLALAVPMSLQLRRLHRRHRLRLPPAAGWWWVFLLWVALGATMLWVDAPGAVPGGEASRLLVFGFRLAWYAACGVVLVWVTNLDRSVTDRCLHALLGYLFVICVAGGLLGLLVPAFEVRSAVELVLPRGLAANEFVASLVHPQAADVQTVLGRPEARPKAPFPFTNTWGSSLSISLVFFVLVLRAGGARVRLAGLLVLAVAAVPVVYSLNRGLWASIAVGVVGIVVLAVRRDARAALVVVVGVFLGVVLLLASPLGALYQDRLDHQHSNDRREQLLEATIDSVTRGSPVLGFGTTRDVEGSFASITGAATPECPACGVPPLGTQGQLWLVVFSQGWLGLAFFLGFVARSLARSWRCRTPAETAGTFVIGFFVLQLPIYDTLGIPLYLMMVAIGLVAREQLPPRAPSRAPAHSFPLVAAVLATTTVLGAAAGLAIAATERAPGYESRVSILITPAPVYLGTGSTLAGTRLAPAEVPREVTVDTEAALLKSQPALAQAALTSGNAIDDLRAGITVTAPPSSQVLDVAVRAPTPDRAEAAVTAVAGAYLEVRRAYLEKRRDETIAKLRAQLRTIGTGSARLTAARDLVSARITHLQVARPTIGRIIRTSPATPVSTQPVVPVASGAALGLIAGLVRLRRRTSLTPFQPVPRRSP